MGYSFYGYNQFWIDLCLVGISFSAILNNIEAIAKSRQTLSLQIMSIFLRSNLVGWANYGHQFLYIFISFLYRIILFNRLYCANRMLTVIKFISERFKRDILFAQIKERRCFMDSIFMGFCSPLFSQFYFEIKLKEKWKKK